MDAGQGQVRSRILVLAGEPPESPGGMEHVIRELTKGLLDRGYEVEVLHRGNAAPGWVAHPANKWQAYIADPLLGWFLGRKVKERMGPGVAAVVSNGFFGWYLPGLTRSVKKIHIYHGTYRGVSNAIRPFISTFGAFKLKWWDSMVLERLSGRQKQVICNSDQTQDEVLRYFGHRSVTMWLPMDTDHFRPLDKMQCRREFSLPPDRKIGMFAGSIQPSKGFPIVHSLIKSMPEVHWILALRGEIPNDLNGQDRISLFRDASAQILPSLYSAADFSVAPSEYEPFGYVVAEALSCGTPVIASPGGASRRFLNQAPFLSFLIEPPNTIEKFTAEAERIMHDPEYYRSSVIRQIRPEIETVMSRDTWLKNFCELTGL
jgi:glycosyltransferase involved in cell wall biosynthesis